MIRTGIGAMVVSAALATSVAARQAKDASAPGEKVFTDQKCSLCHSIAGKGNAKGPLDEVGSTLSADDIRAWIVDAKGMTTKTHAPRKPRIDLNDPNQRTAAVIILP
jgi:mono/diheme cytochrome c family protein